MTPHRALEAKTDSARLDRAVVLVAFVVALVLASLASDAYVSNDGAQYLSTIQELLAGNGLKTTAVYYEVQAQFGMPAQQTVWPPGLPLVAAAVAALTGLDDVHAVAILSAAAHVATAVLLYVLCKRLLKGDTLAALVIGFCYLAYAFALTFTVAVLSEPLFTLCLVASATCLHRAYTVPENERVAWLLVASLLVGLSCLFRYLGLAFLLMLGVLALWDLVRSRLSRSALVAAVALVGPASLVLGALFTRNLMLTGRLTGGPTAARGLELSEILVQSKWALIGLVGGAPSWYAKLAVVAFVASFGVWLGAKILRTSWRTVTWTEGAQRLAAFTLGGTLLTVAIVLWLALRKTGISIDGRYFQPCVPMAVIGFAALWPSLGPVGPRLASFGFQAAAASAVILTLVNLVPFVNWLDTGGTPAQLTQILKQETAGRPALDLLASGASVTSPVMSNQSQGLYVVLRRPTLGVPERRLTPTQWTPEQVVDFARRFGVAYLAVFRKLPVGSADGSDDYVWQAGRLSTPGLEPIHMSDDLAIFRVTPGTAAAEAGSGPAP